MHLLWSLFMLTSISSCLATEPACTFHDYDLSSLTSTRTDLVARMNSPYIYAPYNQTNIYTDYYLYLNPCSEVNDIRGHAQHAEVFGAFPTQPHQTQVSDVLGYNNDTETLWQYRVDEDPYDGVQQIITTPATCHWSNAASPLDTITTITYQCAPPPPIDNEYIIGSGIIQDNICQVDILVERPQACVVVQPMMTCTIQVADRQWDLSWLAGLERNGTGKVHRDGSQNGYYMNVCHNVTHYTVSRDDDAMIVQYLTGANAFQATLASLKTPPIWSLIDNNPELGIRGTWLMNTTYDRHCTSIHNTTVDFVCVQDDTLPLQYVDRDRRSFDVEEISACNTKITYKARNACVLPPVPTTVAPTTPAPTTPAPTTEAPTTQAPTTQAPTTEAPTTAAPTTEAPTTEAPTTAAPTTAIPTTEGPTTRVPTTVPPTNSTPTIAPKHEESSSSPPMTIIIGVGVGGGLFFIILLYFIIRCYCRNKRKPSRSINQMHARDPLLDD